MQIQFGQRVITYPGPVLGELRVSNDLLYDQAALGARLTEDGYLLIRGLIDRDEVLAARDRILQHMNEHEGLEPGSRPLNGVMGPGTLTLEKITHDHHQQP